MWRTLWRCIQAEGGLFWNVTARMLRLHSTGRFIRRMPWRQCFRSVSEKSINDFYLFVGYLHSQRKVVPVFSQLEVYNLLYIFYVWRCQYYRIPGIRECLSQSYRTSCERAEEKPAYKIEKNPKTWCDSQSCGYIHSLPCQQLQPKIRENTQSPYGCGS